MQSLFFCGTMCSMVKTREIYYEDAYLAEFDATVLECSVREKGGFSVTLDATAFFPEQGGQIRFLFFLVCTYIFNNVILIIFFDTSLTRY